MKAVRVICGKNFRLDTTWIARWTADARAGEIRRKGKLARVIKVTGLGYTVWEGPAHEKARQL